MKYTVITGASSGIGKETALEFAKRSKNMVLVARREDLLNEVKNEIQKINKDVNVIVKSSDLSDMDNVYSLYESLKELDIETWINNAGFGNMTSIKDQKLNKIQKMISLNIEALTILSTLYVRDYENIDNTQLINISSGAGYTIIANSVTYSATKFYVSAFTEGLAEELKYKKSKLKAKILAPAATETEFISRALNNKSDFIKLEGLIPKYNTAKEMAKYLLDLYDSEKVVGIVNGETYDYELTDYKFNIARRY